VYDFGLKPQCKQALTGFYQSFGTVNRLHLQRSSIKKKLFLDSLTLEDETDRVTETSVITYERCMASQKAGRSICTNFSVIIIKVFDAHIVIISPLSTPPHKYDYSYYQQVQVTLNWLLYRAWVRRRSYWCIL